MSLQGISMEERNDEWGEGCHIDGGYCIGCGDCDDAASFAGESESWTEWMKDEEFSTENGQAAHERAVREGK
jgi:hypothetical protein